MNRRNFLGGVGTTLLGYTLLKKTPTLLRDTVPPLVHTISYEPAQLVPKSLRDIEIRIPESLRGAGEILITQNLYSKPDKILSEETVSISDRDLGERVTVPLETQKRNEETAYTAYYKKESEESWTYIGESEPLETRSNSVEENSDAIEYPSEDKTTDKFTRRSRRGYFIIEQELKGKTYEYLVSKQMYNSHTRLLGYGKSHKHAIENEFAEYLAQTILNQLDTDSEFEKIQTISEFVQELKWKSDLETEGQYEYIRTPQMTAVTGYGDCKDTTVLLNGMLSKGLEIETSVLFAPNHMMTGVNVDCLEEETIEAFEQMIEEDDYDDYEYTEVSSLESTFIPIEPTSKRPIGVPGQEPIHTIYTDHYEVLKPLAFAKHSTDGFVAMVNGEEPGSEA